MSFFFSSRRRHTRWPRDWSSDVCSSDLAEHLSALVRSAGAPVILGGDLNETADGAARRFLEPVLTDPAEQSEHTFPATDPRRRIDAILTTPGMQVRAAGTVTSTRRVDAERLAGASDHLPTLLDVTV